MFLPAFTNTYISRTESDNKEWDIIKKLVVGLNASKATNRVLWQEYEGWFYYGECNQEGLPQNVVI